LCLRLFEAMCYSSSSSAALWALEMEWVGNEVRDVGRGEVGRRGKFLGQRRGLKNPWAGEEDVFFCSFPKRLQQPHPELVHWWLLVHSSWKLRGRNLGFKPVRLFFNSRGATWVGACQGS
jgi:hypothetical protein